MLIGSDIKKAYDGQEILKGVSIELTPGKITALIGPSGSGKTTLLRALSFLEPPDSGTISIEEESYTFPLKGKEFVRPPWPHVTVVFQQLFLWPHLTLRENILLPLKDRAEKADPEYFESLIKLFEMQKFIDRYPNEASLGQRQRVALARALVLKPKYILLDEITSSLDVEQVALILSELKALRDRGIGILSITHLLHFARDAADQIVFMDSGEILEHGGREILDQPRHERVARFLSVIESAS